MSFSQSGGTRAIQAGDTPTLDDLGVSVPMGATQNLAKGDVCYISGGVVIAALATDVLDPLVSCIPTESKDNSTGGAGDLEIRVILPNQVVAIKGDSIFTVGQYGGISVDNELIAISQAAQNTTINKFARYLGKEAAIFAIDGTTPFDQSLSTGIVPDQNLADTEIGWFVLTESAL